MEGDRADAALLACAMQNLPLASRCGARRPRPGLVRFLHGETGAPYAWTKNVP